MSNKYKGHKQFKQRTLPMPKEKSLRIIRVFLDSNESRWYEGQPIGNTEFATELGYKAHGSISSLANSWMKGKPIPVSVLIKMRSVYPGFPVRGYIKAYLEDFPDKNGETINSFRLALILAEDHLKATEKLMDEFLTQPTERLSSDSVHLMLEDPFDPFERDRLSDRSVHESSDPTREEKAATKAWFQRRMASKTKKE